MTLYDNNMNQFNEQYDNIMIDQSSIDKISNIGNNSPISNVPKSKTLFQTKIIKGYEDEKSTEYKKNNQRQNVNYKNNRASSYNKSFGNTTPNRSILTKSKLSINSKNNNSCYNKSINRKNSYGNISIKNKNCYNGNNYIKKDSNKENYIINKLTNEVEHIKNYCNELQRQFDNHCLIRNERREFENIKKENIKLTAEISILKEDVSELMKKVSIINNRIESIQQENNTLKLQNKNLLNFLSIMNNNTNGIKKLKSFNMNQISNNNSMLNINNNSNNTNNESMNIINLINDAKNNDNEIKNNIKNLAENKNLKSINNDKYYLNNLNSEQINFSISNSLSKNLDNIQKQNNYDDKYYTGLNYVNKNPNNDMSTKYSKTVSNNFNNNATDIASLIKSNYNLTNQVRNLNNSKNKANRYFIPKNED